MLLEDRILCEPLPSKAFCAFTFGVSTVVPGGLFLSLAGIVLI